MKQQTSLGRLGPPEKRFSPDFLFENMENSELLQRRSMIDAVTMVNFQVEHQ